MALSLCGEGFYLFEVIRKFMHRKRVYIPPDKIKKEDIVVIGEEFHYLKNVLRIKAGESVEIFDGKGKICQTEVRSINTDNIVLEKKQDRETTNKPPLFISLAQAVTRSKIMDIIIEKAAEIGVREIIPFICSGAREEVSKNFDSKKKRWERIVLESVRLTGGAFIPRIEGISTFEGLVNQKQSGLNIILWEEERKNMLKDILNKNIGIKSARIFIGPEAGFKDKEINIAREAGIIPASLGPLRLRSETAAISALALAANLLAG